MIWFLVLAGFVWFFFLCYAAATRNDAENERPVEDISKPTMVDKKEVNVNDVIKYLPEGWYKNEDYYLNVKTNTERYLTRYNVKSYYLFKKEIESFKLLNYAYTYQLVNPFEYGDQNLGNYDEMVNNYNFSEFNSCEDPHKTHWEYFLKLEMLAKKQREVDCHKYVDTILHKQITYNDLNLQYQMLPSAPITDVESFRNFCKVVHEDTKYEDYEIQNYLLLKRSTK